MAARVMDRKRNGVSTGVLLGLAVCVLALPSAVLAFSSSLEPGDGTNGAKGGAASFSGSGNRMAAGIPVRSLGQGHPFRFTPAGLQTRPDRAVTVAVRVDSGLAGGITVRGSRQSAAQPASSGLVSLQIAPAAFNLGVARGYNVFAQALGTGKEQRKPELPDISGFKLNQSAAGESSRFAPRISLDDRAPTGRSPRTYGGAGQDKVDLGGALRLTRNLDVTAGVRYSQQRERLPSITDSKQDSQAVYVGTQFRF